MTYAYAISRIVDRCHCMDSNRQVINYVVSKMKGKRKGFLQLDRKLRRVIMKVAINRHSQNTNLYLKVTGSVGNLKLEV